MTRRRVARMLLLGSHSLQCGPIRPSRPMGGSDADQELRFAVLVGLGRLFIRQIKIAIEGQAPWLEVQNKQRSES